MQTLLLEIPITDELLDVARDYWGLKNPTQSQLEELAEVLLHMAVEDVASVAQLEVPKIH